MLLPGTVRQNLELFGPLCDLDEACRAACFDEVLAHLPDGLHTMLGAAGSACRWVNGSGSDWPGRWDRLHPCCSLDEPTAHLDAAAEDRVLHAIRQRAADGATVIVVGHREPVLAIGDRVLHMGSLVDA